MNTKEFETLLLAEKKKIEETLSATATKNPLNPNEWAVTYPDLNGERADKNDMADEVEEFDNTLGINHVLEEKLTDINAALERIKINSFGICEVDGKPIDEGRLLANPAARTCVAHAAQ